MNFIDLFAGAGGLSEGFIRAGYEPIAHVEADKAACLTLKTRVAYHYLRETNDLEKYHEYLKGEIDRETLYAYIPDHLMSSVINKTISSENNKEIFDSIDYLKEDREVDMIVGGPPCQAYSTTGRGALKHKKKDERKNLFIEYGKFLNYYKPKLFVFENVPGLKSSDGGIYYAAIKKYFKKLGYFIDERLLDARDFGVVQQRRRLIIIGWRKDVTFAYPEFDPVNKQHFRDDIFSDLPPLKPGEGHRWTKYSGESTDFLHQSSIRNGIDFTTLHVARPHNEKDLEIYKLAIQRLENGSRIKNCDIPESMRTQKNVEDFLDRFKVVDRLPHTMIAHIAKDGHHFIHPSPDQLRSISVREAARIQSFPDDFYFEGVKENQNRTAAFKQIGNAVPPLMAQSIAQRIFTIIGN
ncbi:DNA cytosine methyltransferase [Sphingobacterium corticibacterium]|uniref:Cytosine-specific methyltransferase n=1 Tax=Sphingobacterium corticibacterium TaxID=2484746 RepID=A0A4Q6XZ03_9SPHI|nr:DNA cytosine methyltransferase [Sphingobacterium corticibacterium]RZF62199.1 DNA cytosine methyltransferase [Sphingobacterium corticibacterium]